MAQDSDTTPLSFVTYYSATERGALPFERPALLGTFSSPTDIRALVRMADGDLTFIHRGDLIGQAEVIAIGDGYLELGLLGEVHRLTIPGQT